VKILKEKCKELENEDQEVIEEEETKVEDK